MGALALRGVSKSFRTHTGPNVVLRDVTLEVPAGCLYGLIGPGAAGKSVAAQDDRGPRCEPDHGAVIVDGEDITTLPELALQADSRQDRDALPEQRALRPPDRGGERRVPAATAVHASARTRSPQRVGERLACVSLPGFEARLPSGLSGGQKKRVGVARATVTRAPHRALRRARRGPRPGHVARRSSSSCATSSARRARPS